MIEIVITAVGPDRPGLVDAITGAVYAAKANIADSRMLNFRGQFALLLLAEAPDQPCADELERTVKRAGEEAGLHVTTAAQEHAVALTTFGGAGLPLRLRASAVDQPGIVHRITRALHELGVNIEQLATTLVPASYASPPVFNIEMTITAPASVSIKHLRQAISTLGDELNCDIAIEPGK